MKRIISAILSMALLLSAIPFGALQVSAAADDFSVGQNGYVSDPSTIDSYKDYFTADSTEFAGAVWTDKSVFTKDNIGQNPFGITKDHAGHTLTDIKEIKNNEFLVSLSALSSTKQIEGYSYLPTDTILVLDLSGSMLNAGELDALLEAANKAIAELLNLNKHNRVGVVVYSNDGQEFFPLDRYTTTKRTTGSNAYDVYLEKNGNSQVRTARSGNTNVVKNSNGATMNKTYSLSSTGRTYIQSGLNVARNMFEGVEDITIPTGEIMGGTKRKPIVVLMSDGAPTRATASYTFANSSNPSYVTTNGYNSSDFHTFATQLTAAYVDREIGEHYDGECLFYTLGFNLENDVQRALSVLNPDSSTTAINNLWQAYQTATQNVTNIVSYGSGYNTTYLRRLEGGSDGLDSNKSYADKYFPAETTNDLIEAFDDIVDQIIIQSKYYPTLVSSGQYDMDGYVTIVDELGANMEVKDIRGIVLGDVLYTGEAMAQAMSQGANGPYGNSTTWSELGWELVYSIAERLNVSNDVAIDMLTKAWADTVGNSSDRKTQLYYENADSWGNYISYYLDDDNKNLGWRDEDDTSAAYPTGTKYIGRSYIFQGTVNDRDSNVHESEMLHIVVQVFEDVTTGEQTVTFRVPASLVPLSLYEVEVEGNVLNEQTVVDSFTFQEETPIRLLYDVGLVDEITPINLAEKMSAADAHKHPTGDGGYYFYSNSWGTVTDNDGIDIEDPNGHSATVAHYLPSKENERYYYAEDSIVYDANGNKQTDKNSKPTGSGYKHAIYTIKKDGNANTVDVTWLNINAQTLSNYAVYDDDSGVWYIPKGTSYRQTTRDEKAKTSNNTGTLTYVDNPLINANSTSYQMYTFLGNNGRLALYPATGLKLTKNVAAASPENDAINTFTFEIEFTGLPAVPAGVKVTDADYNTFASGTNGNKITVTLTDGQTVYITGLDAGVDYTVTELGNEFYTVQSSTGAQGTTVANTINAVEFINTAASRKGNLQISKTVTHPYGDNYVIPDGKVFNVEVTLTDKNNAPITSAAGLAISGTTNDGTAITAFPAIDGNGKFTLQLAHEDSVTITGLPHGAEYTVTETALPAGFALDGTNSTGLDGTIVTDQTAYAHLVNDYEPTSWPTNANLDLKITKNLEGVTWDEIPGSAFQFKLEKYNLTTGQWEDHGHTTDLTITAASGNSATNTLVGATTYKEGTTDNIPFEYLGTHYYRITEIPGNIDGITYDTTHAYFRVVVTDDDMDGTPEMEVVAANNTTLSTDNGIDTISATFTNRYNSTVAEINIHKDLTNDTGVQIPMDSFEFVLCEGATCSGDGCTNNHTTVKPNINGDVIIPKAYTSTETGFVAVGNPTVTNGEETYSDVCDDNAGTGTRTYTRNVTSVQKYEMTESYNITEKNGGMTGMDYSDAEVEATVTVSKEVTTTWTETKTVSLEKVQVTAATEEWSEVSGTETAWTEATTPQDEVTSLTSKVAYAEDDDTVDASTDTDATFANEYTVTPVTAAAISGKKIFNRKLEADDFSFKLYAADNAFNKGAEIDEAGVTAADADVSTGVAEGSFAFDAITYTTAGTYYYVAEEVIPTAATAENGYTVDGVTYDSTVYHITVTVGLAGDGTNALVANTPTINQVGGSGTSLAFTNSYNITGTAKATFEATKKLNGRALGEDEFTFSLYETDSSWATDGVTPLYDDIGHYANTGTLKMPEITYTKDDIDTHYYVLKENIPVPGLGGVTYDNSTVKIKVEVKDDTKGGITATVTYPENDQLFENTYTASPVSLTVAGDKWYADHTNAAISMAGGEFTFELLKADNLYVIDQAAAPVEITNGEGTDVDNDQFAFKLNYTEPGTHYYVLREKSGSSPTTIYDAAEYHIMVVVLDNGIGQLTTMMTAETADGTHVTLGFDDDFQDGDSRRYLEFKNSEREVTDLDVDFSIKKNVVKLGTADHTLANFKFEVENVTTGTVYSENPVSGNDGTTAFTVTYKKADIGKEYEYIIREIDTGIADMVYDATEYTVKVKVEFIANQLVTTKTLTNNTTGASAVVDEVEVTFNNEYSGNVPKQDPPKDPGKKVRVDSVPDTGDISSTAPYLALMAAAVAAAIVIILIRRRKKDDEAEA